jgi:hypothetical protein
MVSPNDQDAQNIGPRTASATSHGLALASSTAAAHERERAGRAGLRTGARPVAPAVRVKRALFRHSRR